MQSPSPQATNIVSAQGLTSLCFLHTLSMAAKIPITDISDVGNWWEDEHHVEINITAAGKGVKLRIDQPSSTKPPLEITIPKQQAAVTVNGSAENTKGGGKQTEKDEKSKEGSGKQKKEDEKPKEGSGKQKKEDQEPKRDETMLENAMTKLKAYKGILITAFIAISLGYLLRRKFKAA